MMNKYSKQLQIVVAFILIFLCLFRSFASVHALSVPNVIWNENEGEGNTPSPNPQGGSSGCNAYATEEERKQCEKDREAPLETADFYTKAIMSLNTEIAKQEVNQDYIKNFSNSSVTALSYDFSLVDPDTIIMHMVNVLITIIEMIGQLISLIVLILYNVASNSFWESIITNIFNVFDKVLFNWSDPNSWFVKILILFGILSVIKTVSAEWKRMFSIKQLLEVVAQVVISCLLIVFIAQNGRPIITYVESMVTESVAQSFNFVDDQYDKNLPMEINVKNQIFEVMQKQGFILRHFGVTSASQISNVNTGDYSEGDAGEEIQVTGEQRVRKLLDDPSKDNSQIERKLYGNNQIAYSGARCLAIVGLSFVFLIHRILMGILLGSSSLLLLVIGFFKEVTLATSIYALVILLFKRDRKIAFTWFSGRMKWCIMFILASLLFNMLLSFVIMLVNGVTSLPGAPSLLIIIPIDAILCYGMFYVVKHAPEIWQKITADFEAEGDGVFNIAKGIISGDMTPSDVYGNYKERRAEEKVELDDTSASIKGKKSNIESSNNAKELEESYEEGNIDEEVPNIDGSGSSNLDSNTSINGDALNETVDTGEAIEDLKADDEEVQENNNSNNNNLENKDINLVEGNDTEEQVDDKNTNNLDSNDTDLIEGNEEDLIIENENINNLGGGDDNLIEESIEESKVDENDSSMPIDSIPAQKEVAVQEVSEDKQTNTTPLNDEKDLIDHDVVNDSIKETSHTNQDKKEVSDPTDFDDEIKLENTVDKDTANNEIDDFMDSVLGKDDD